MGDIFTDNGDHSAKCRLRYSSVFSFGRRAGIDKTYLSVHLWFKIQSDINSIIFIIRKRGCATC